MEIKRTGYQFTVIKNDEGKFQAVMILSVHEKLDDALEAMFEAMDIEAEENMQKEVERLREKGINAKTVKEAIKDMNPEEREKFLEERNRKFVDPILKMNTDMLEGKARRLKIKRVK